MAGGVSQLKKTKNASPLTNPFITILAMPLASTEYSFVFPIETKYFEVKLRKHAILKYAYVAGETLADEYRTPGRFFGMDAMELASALTVYFRSTENDDTLEIEYWT